MNEGINLLNETQKYIFNHGKSLEDIAYAELYFDMSTKKHIKLDTKYNEYEFEQFKKLLDMEYDNGFGGQEVYGYIVFKDNTWIERHEYDGAEWWEYKETPKEPNALIGINIEIFDDEDSRCWDLQESLRFDK